MPAPIILTGPRQRAYACEQIRKAPEGHIVTIKEPTRNLEQNARLWAMLGDISKAQPEGFKMTPDDWKCVFMNALGYETRFVMGLDGRPFPAGFKSSRLTVRQMADLLTFIAQKGDEWGVQWSEPNPYEESA